MGLEFRSAVDLFQRSITLIGMAAGLIMMTTIAPASAQSSRLLPPITAPSAEAPPPELTQRPDALNAPTSEVWTGGEAMRDVWSIYTGMTWSPFGAIARDGWRLRFTGGYGQYRYRAAINGTPQSIKGQTIKGMSTFSDVLAGYQVGFAAVTLKGFIGASFDGHLLRPFDPDNAVNGQATGIKAALEAWINLSPQSFASLDLSYAGANKAYVGRLRVGRRLTSNIAAGVEAAVHRNAGGDRARGGVFARYKWGVSDVTVAGGVAGGDGSERTGYGSLVYLTRF